MSTEQIVTAASETYDALTESYRKAETAVDFDFRAHCSRWIARGGDQLTHRVHRYPARLTPYIPFFFLGVRQLAPARGILLDPFAGCGTVLVEAPVHPCHPMDAIGIEINPLAHLIAKVKTTPLDRRAVLACWARVQRRYLADVGPRRLPDFPNKRHWFTVAVENRLARVVRAVQGIREPDLRDFFLVTASSVVRQVALADPGVSVPVLLDAERFTDPARRRSVTAQIAARTDADVLGIFESCVRANANRIDAWKNVAVLNRGRSHVIRGDARHFGRAAAFDSASAVDPSALPGVDLILTSPPYANAQRYTRSLRLEMFVLGITKGSDDESKLDALQVGTERVKFDARASLFAPTSCAAADTAIASIARTDEYRAAIVGKYVRDMRQVMRNCFDALKPGGHAVFVIGNNCVRGHEVDNAAILSELGTEAGFREHLRLRNRIPSRGLLTKRHPTAGVITHEFVLTLGKPLESTHV